MCSTTVWFSRRTSWGSAQVFYLLRASFFPLFLAQPLPLLAKKKCTPSPSHLPSPFILFARGAFFFIYFFGFSSFVLPHVCVCVCVYFKINFFCLLFWKKKVRGWSKWRSHVKQRRTFRVHRFSSQKKKTNSKQRERERTTPPLQKRFIVYFFFSVAKMEKMLENSPPSLLPICLL